MSLRMRSAYEKTRRVSSTVRRGRVPGVPVEIYHDMDNLTRRLDGLARILGVSGESLGVAASTQFVPLSEEAVPPQFQRGTSIAERPGFYRLLPDLTGGNYDDKTLTVHSQYPFIVSSAIGVAWRAQTGSTRTINFDLYVGEESILTLTSLSTSGVQSEDGWYFKQVNPSTIRSHSLAKQLQLPAESNTKGRKFPDNAPIRAVATYPSFSLQVGVDIFVTHLVEVGA